MNEKKKNLICSVQKVDGLSISSLVFSYDVLLIFSRTIHLACFVKGVLRLSAQRDLHIDLLFRGKIKVGLLAPAAFFKPRKGRTLGYSIPPPMN